MASASDVVASAGSPEPPPARKDRTWPTVFGATLALGVLVFVAVPHSPRPFWSRFFRGYPWPWIISNWLDRPAASATLLGRLTP